MFTTEHLMVSGLLFVCFKNPRNVKLTKWFKKKKKKDVIFVGGCVFTSNFYLNTLFTVDLKRFLVPTVSVKVEITS